MVRTNLVGRPYIIFGLPKSGTNYLNSLLSSNKCLNVSSLGHKFWKHNTISRPKGAVVIFAYRPLLPWLQSIRRFRGATRTWFKKNRGVGFPNISEMATYYAEYVSSQLTEADVAIITSELLLDHDKESAALNTAGLIVGKPHRNRVTTSGRVSRRKFTVEKVRSFPPADERALYQLLRGDVGQKLSGVRGWDTGLDRLENE